MRSLDHMLSRLLFLSVMSLIVFAITANFVIIAQALFSPLSVVEGGSMKPAIKGDDAVVITSTDPSQLKVGDVVAFEDPESRGDTIIHRIVGMEGKGPELIVETKGDANVSPDPYATPASSIDGKVSVVLPRVGLFLSFLHTMPGFIVCVICPFCLLLLYLMSHWYLEKVGSRAGLLSREIITLR